MNGITRVPIWPIIIITQEFRTETCEHSTKIDPQYTSLKVEKGSAEIENKRHESGFSTLVEPVHQAQVQFYSDL